jgi:adenosylhomocysteine nucleosidase
MPEVTAILVAYPPEWDALAPLVADAEEQRLHGLRTLTGTIDSRRVVLAHTGLSMVNAAMNAQLLLAKFPVTRIVVSGIAGGLDPTLAPGTIVVPERWGCFLEVAITGVSPLPLLPAATDLPPWGALVPRDTLCARPGEPERAHRWFPVDAMLLRAAASAEPLVPLQVGGAGVSGSAFVDRADYRDYLHATFGAAVVDMETAAIAQVAMVNGVPFVGIRAISDLAGGDTDGNRIAAGMAEAAHNAAATVRALIAELPK